MSQEQYPQSEPDKQQTILHMLAFASTYYIYKVEVKITCAIIILDTLGVLQEQIL